MYVSSSTTGGRTQVRTMGIPSKCWYGNFITESSSPNPIKTHTANIIGVSMRLKRSLGVDMDNLNLDSLPPSMLHQILSKVATSSIRNFGVQDRCFSRVQCNW
ncbi:unnamed protein product [Brassica rapa subsp. trilocularis]